MKVIMKANYLFISINIFLAILIVPSLCNAATYYVDATKGNDSNNGLSESLAWKTIAKVNTSKFNPGDQILFKRGETWREQLTVSSSSSGSAGSPITFTAYGSGKKPVVDGENTRRVGITIASFDISHSKSYITIDGLAVINTKQGNAGIVSGSYSDHITIQNCDVYNNEDFGIVVTGANSDNTYTTIKNCSIYNNGKNVSALGTGSGILIVGTDDTKRPENTLITGCLIYNNGTDAGHDHGIYDEGYATTTSYNKFYNNAGWGIKISNNWGGSSCEAYGNVVYNHSAGGIVIESSTTAPVNNKVYNNTIYTSIAPTAPYAGFQYAWKSGTPSGNEFKNNIVFYNYAGTCYCVKIQNTGTGLSMENNAYYNPGSSLRFAYNNSLYKTFDLYKAAAKGLDQNYSFYADPKLQDPANNLFYLQNLSPCINAGDATLGVVYSYGLSKDCIWTTNVILERRDTKWDIGAYVYEDKKSLQPPQDLKISP